jgi:predicted RNA polymerase sigma factor
MITRGLTALTRAETLHAENAKQTGPYTLQAAIAACHARALTPEATDWKQIVALYAELGLRAPSPIVELNRAVAVAMADGPAAALEILDTLATEPTLQNYHLLPSVRADFLQKLGRLEEARNEFTHAATLTRNTRERDLLIARAKACANGSAIF